MVGGFQVRQDPHQSLNESVSCTIHAVRSPPRRPHYGISIPRSVLAVGVAGKKRLQSSRTRTRGGRIIEYRDSEPTWWQRRVTGRRASSAVLGRVRKRPSRLSCAGSVDSNDADDEQLGAKQNKWSGWIRTGTCTFRTAFPIPITRSDFLRGQEARCCGTLPAAGPTTRGRQTKASSPLLLSEAEPTQHAK